MKIIQDTISIPANSTIRDVMAENNDDGRFIEASGAVRIGVACDGAALGEVVVNVHVGTRELADNYKVDLDAGPSVDPQKHLKIVGPGFRGQRIRISATNTTVGALTLAYYAITPGA